MSLAEILFDGTRSKGEGVVQFTETAEAQTAGEKFTGYMYGGRALSQLPFPLFTVSSSLYLPVFIGIWSHWLLADPVTRQMSNSTPDGTTLPVRQPKEAKLLPSASQAFQTPKEQVLQKAVLKAKDIRGSDQIVVVKMSMYASLRATGTGRTRAAFGVKSEEPMKPVIRLDEMLRK